MKSGKEMSESRQDSTPRVFTDEELKAFFDSFVDAPPEALRALAGNFWELADEALPLAQDWRDLSRGKAPK